jgi:hypothetical protein
VTAAARVALERTDGRVRVAVRLRPVLPHEEALVVDTAPIIEVEPEVRTRVTVFGTLN